MEFDDNKDAFYVLLKVEHTKRDKKLCVAKFNNSLAYN